MKKKLIILLIISVFLIRFYCYSQEIEFEDTGIRVGFSNGHTYSITTNDFNNDGFTDIVFGSYYWRGSKPGGEVILSNGNGTFSQTTQQIITGNVSWYSYEWSIDSGDVDGDGDIDLIVSDWWTNTPGLGDRILLNRGNGYFDYGQSIGTSDTYKVKLMDIDMDNDLDLLIADYKKLQIYENSGNGQFFGPVQEWPQISYRGRDILVADYDNDNDLDYIYYGGGIEIYYENNGFGEFSILHKLSGSIWSDRGGQAINIDLNKDNTIDVITSGGDVFLNDGHANFTKIGTISDGSFNLNRTMRMVSGDLDLDGDNDCIISYFGSKLIDIFVNDGSGHLSYNNTIEITDSSYGISCIDLFDAENDGDLDLAIGIQFSKNAIFLNKAADKILVKIDIKPEDLPNSINLKSNGVIPVGLLTDTEFNAENINPNTVIFAGAIPVQWALEDVDDDGDIDMIFHFKTKDLNLNTESIEACLSGKTINGKKFEGCDSVNIIK